MRFTIQRLVSRSGRAPSSIRAALIVVGSAVLISVMLGCKPAVVDLKPSFGTRTVADKTYYARGGPISALTLPLATGGDSPLSYRLTPAVPGLKFNTATRVLSGTPTKVDTHTMVYRVTDKDGDSATLRFTITIPEDHGDSKSEATPVQIGAGTISGQVEELSDVDYFTVTVTESGDLVAATDPDNLDHTDTVVSVEGVSGYVNNDPSWFDWVADVSPGTYYLKVERAAGATTGAYELAVWLIGSANDSFDIDVRYLGTPPTTTQQALFDEAAAFWSGAITDDLPDMPVLGSGWTCDEGDSLDFGSTIDDLIIHVKLKPFDGPGGALAFAGPCYIRVEVFGQATIGDLPFIGIVSVDTADLGALETDRELKAVIIHEMAHVLGFGTLWDYFGFLENPSIDPMTDLEVTGQETYFDGTEAITKFNPLDTSDSYVDTQVPVENDTTKYDAGSLDGHWRESVFCTELMTPSIGPGLTNPVSAVTLGSLEDIGYLLDYTAAESYTLPTNCEGGMGLVRGQGIPRTIDLGNDIWDGPIKQVDIPAAIGGRGSR